MRNTTWTSTRDGTEGVTFLQPTFYDGQGMMVPADSGITDLAGLEGGVVCVAAGTTTEGNVATEFERLGLQVPEIQSFDDVNVLQQAFQGSLRRLVVGPQPAHRPAQQLPGRPGVGDPRWDVLQGAARPWRARRRQPVGAGGRVVFATVQAEEFGVTSRTSTRSASDDPSIRAFLGSEVEGEEGAAVLDPGLGLPTDFAYQVVSQVGNYAEIYEEHILRSASTAAPTLWTDGGLLYAPPYR